MDLLSDRFCSSAALLSTMSASFDERFFLYAEETDWQRRAVKNGWTIGFVPEVTGTHIGAGTGGSSRAPIPAVPHIPADLYREALRPARLGSFRLAMVLGGLIRAILTQRGTSKSRRRRRIRLYVNPARAGADG